MAYRVIHYINQFFAGIGGEDKADVAPEVREGVVGPGMAFKAALGNEAEIVATFICGDNYFANSEPHARDRANANPGVLLWPVARFSLPTIPRFLPTFRRVWKFLCWTAARATR